MVQNPVISSAGGCTVTFPQATTSWIRHEIVFGENVKSSAYSVQVPKNSIVYLEVSLDGPSNVVTSGQVSTIYIDSPAQEWSGVYYVYGDCSFDASSGPIIG